MSSGKGDRRERQAAGIYQRAGYDTQQARGTRFAEKDWWGLYDLAAFSDARNELRLVQVKSNRAAGIEQWVTNARPFNELCDVVTDFLVAHDRKGWRCLRPTAKGYACVYDGRDSALDMGEGITEWIQNE